METNIQLNSLIGTIKRIEQKVEFIEDEIITIKSWLNDDSKLTPYEKKIVDESIKKVKTGNFTNMVTLEDLKKKIGV